MSKMFKLTIILLTIGAIACMKVDSDSGPGTGLVDQWEFTEQLLDPGNGSGTWQAAPEGHRIEFKADGSFVGDVYMFQDYNRYEVLNDSALKLFKPDNSFHPLSYKLSDNGLELNPLCVERCGFKFVRQ